MEKLLETYETFNILVGDIYKDCLEGGYTKSGSIGKIKYELTPMAKTDKEKAILYFELGYLLAKEDLQEEFSNLYEEYKSLLMNKEVSGLIANSEKLRSQENEIAKYAKKLTL